MKRLLHISLFIIGGSCFAQSRLVFSDDGYMVISNSAYVVIDNGNANAITQTGTGGRVITEAETNRIRWNISNNTGTYTIPFFDDDNALEIPFSVNITTAGTAGASNRIDFSTYDNASWDNATYMPTGVTNMASSIGGANNSAKVIDRFWVADATSYATKPTAILSFTYIDAEWSGGSNTITEANLRAQRWSTTLNSWDAYLPQGTQANAGVQGTVVNVPAAPADFFRVWTLVDNTSPLPIELTSFTGKCDDKNISLAWSTASETNNNFFTLEKSTDGISYYTLATITGAGTSTGTVNYFYSDNANFGTGAYYRLRQTDYNGQSETFPSIFVSSCLSENVSLDIYNQGENNFTLLINEPDQDNYTVTVYNTVGQIILSQKIFAAEGINKFTIPLENIDDALYLVNINDGKRRSLTKKIIINQ